MAGKETRLSLASYKRTSVVADQSRTAIDTLVGQPHVFNTFVNAQRFVDKVVVSSF